MPETAEQIYDRCHDRLVLPDVDEWETFPFAGELGVRPLKAPLEAEPPRHGAGGRCKSGARHRICTSATQRTKHTQRESGARHRIT
jgi:hypothetical protein